jgi:hypothetical protein
VGMQHQIFASEKCEIYWQWQCTSHGLYVYHRVPSGKQT